MKPMQTLQNNDHEHRAGCGSPDAACSADYIINEIRRWLKDGATIRATDTEKPVLELMPGGWWNGGMTIEYPPNARGAGAENNQPNETDGNSTK